MQEHILNSVARFKDGVPANVFMVGDVKQSIYRFRQARPQLFLQKVETYGEGRSEGEVLFLNENYRSRKEILEGVNYVFRQIMRADFGGIIYDENVQLNHPKKDLLPDPDWLPEVLICDASGEGVPAQDGDEDEEEGENGETGNTSSEEDDLPPVSEDVLEARMIGRKILSLVKGEKPMMIPNEAFDKDKPESESNSEKRPVTFGDVVILQRSVSGCGNMLREFEKMGVPVQLEDPKAYFYAEEVVILLSVLNLIDNSRQDIPYAAALHSPVAEVTDEELAYLATRRFSPAVSLFDTADTWIRREKAGKNPAEEKNTEYFTALRKNLLTKLIRLHEMLEVWKKECKYLSISQLISRILEDTGFREAVAKMPRGERRLKNISQMIYKAEVFEGGGDSGLFTFLRYIEKCKYHEADFADRGGASEGVNAVRICTIHSSKGLEYPVVFVARLGKQFNRKGYTGKAIVSADFGIAPQRIRKIAGKYWLSEKGIQWNAVKQLDIQESLYDEERLLYVAMTRAKEMLYLTGVRKGFASEMRDAEFSGGCGEITYGQLAGAKGYLDFLVPSLLHNLEETAKYYKIEVYTSDELTEENAAEESAAISEAEENAKDTEDTAVSESEAEIMDNPKDSLNDKKDEKLTPEQILAMHNFCYPYQGAVETKAKLTVSEVKEKAEKLALAKAEAEKQSDGTDTSEESAKAENEKGKKSGSIRRNRNKVSGSEYGTAVHKLMELLPIKDIENAADMKKALEELLASSYFTDDLRKAVRIPAVSRFYSASPDSLFQRMKRAEERGLLRREQQFLIGIPADKVGVDLPLAEVGEEDPRFSTLETTYPVAEKEITCGSEETIVLQGVIDAFFLEEDEDGNLYAVVVDYKTDHVDTPEELILRYKTQLVLYSDTISDILGIPVREMWLYGFNKDLGEIRL
jgi:ATP-dependent helicase/nuclease subunit A